MQKNLIYLKLTEEKNDIGKEEARETGKEQETSLYTMGDAGNSNKIHCRI